MRAKTLSNSKSHVRDMLARFWCGCGMTVCLFSELRLRMSKLVCRRALRRLWKSRVASTPLPTSPFPCKGVARIARRQRWTTYNAHSLQGWLHGSREVCVRGCTKPAMYADSCTDPAKSVSPVAYFAASLQRVVQSAQWRKRARASSGCAKSPLSRESAGPHSLVAPMLDIMPFMP